MKYAYNYGFYVTSLISYKSITSISRVISRKSNSLGKLEKILNFKILKNIF